MPVIMLIALCLVVFVVIVLWAVARLTFNSTFERKQIIKPRLFELEHIHKTLIIEAGQWIREQEPAVIRIRGNDGAELIAHVVENDASVRTVLLFPGWRGKWDGLLSVIAKWMFENGCRVVLIESRGSEGSEGKYIGMGMLEKYDMRLWIEKCRENFPREPLFLYGVSMGCAGMLLAAENSWNEKVSGMIADCGFANAYDQIKQTVAKKTGLPEHPVMDFLNLIVRLRLKENMKENDTHKSIVNCSIPVLFIHGEKDGFVDKSSTEGNYELYRGPKKLLIVPGAGHADAYAVATEEIQGLIQELFDGKIN